MTARYDYILWSETDDDDGSWRFALRSVTGRDSLEAEDIEPRDRGERLQLLAIVRALEAIDRPARVALVTRSRYVYRGLTLGLRQWREQGWMWESFGRMTPVKNADLWKRLDRAGAIHTIECRSPAAARHINRREAEPGSARQRLDVGRSRNPKPPNPKPQWWKRLAETAGRAVTGLVAPRDRGLVCE